jgi:hypothetical protein
VETSQQQCRSAMAVAPSKSENINKKELDFTKMILYSYLAYLLSNVIDSVATIADILSIDIYYKYGAINNVGNGLFFFSHSIKLFIFNKYNKKFRNSFSQTFLCRKKNNGSHERSNNKQIVESHLSLNVTKSS